MSKPNEIPLAYRVADDLTTRVMAALQQVTGRTEGYTIDDLASVDGFHVRGRLGTSLLAKMARLGTSSGGSDHEALEVLDVGSGPGGSARHLAVHHGCQVTGLDINPVYVDLAETLSAITGLSERTTFKVGSATEMPFAKDSFDVVWSEHMQMNIPDKKTLARELSRVLRPGGRLVMHEVFSGEGDPPLYPVPWAESAADCALAPASSWMEKLEGQGLTLDTWQDVTRESGTWFSAMVAKRMADPAGDSPLGLQLLMRGHAREKFANLARNLTEGRVMVVMLVAQSGK